MAKTVGTMPPPMKPCIARQTIILSIDDDRPHMTLEKVKPAAAIENSMRVPSALDRKPESGIAITSAIRYEVCTHGISSAEADNPAWISLSEADTIWMSRIAMNMPKHITTKAAMRRLFEPSALSAPPVGERAETESASGVVAMAMIGSWR